MSTFKYMGLEIQLGGIERKDGYIALVNKNNPDGVIKEYFTIISNDQHTFKEIDIKSPTFNFQALERQLFGLLFKFTESTSQNDVVIIGFRFFQRPSKGMSSIGVTKHKNTQGSYDLVIDFIRPILQPMKKYHDNSKHKEDNVSAPIGIDPASIPDTSANQEMTPPVPATPEMLNGLTDRFQKS